MYSVRTPAPEVTRRLDRQALPFELIDGDQQLQLPTILSPLTDEVVAPHVVAVHWLVTHASVVAAATPDAEGQAFDRTAWIVEGVLLALGLLIQRLVTRRSALQPQFSRP